MKTTESEYLDLNVVNIYDKTDEILRYNSAIEKRLIEFATDGFPYEIAGFMLGKKKESIEEVTELVKVKNIAQHQERRFEIAPLDYVQVENYALSRGLDLIGVYHSHPDYPAIPSKHDLASAQEVFAYLIIDIEANGLSQITSWKIETFGNDAVGSKKGKFIEQKIEIK